MKISSISVVAITAFLAACGGGGGGGNPSPATAFTSFPIPPSSKVILQGDSAQGTYTYNTGTGSLTSMTPNPPQQPGATCTITTDGSGDISVINLTTASGTNLRWASPTDTIINIPSTNILVASSANGLYGMLGGNPSSLGWNYQDFGVWSTDTNRGSGTFGAASFGVATPVASLPTLGTATYSGITGGLYINASSTQYLTTSNLTSNVDFAARTLTYTTSSTQQTTDGLTFTANPVLDSTGTLSYSAGSNQFTGAINNTGSTLAGTATGRFYGPGAEEIGGTFYMAGSVGHYFGGFGAKR